tara:strand:+ start:133 stop:705 length:573 start_codon:yes stop_codon:yes gene_type:complete
MNESRSDNDIIQEIKKGINISENYQIISDRHSGIFYKMADKWISKKFKEKRLDFFRDKDYYIFQVILDYNEDKNTKFSTYLGNRIKWMCINNYYKEINCCEINCPDQLMYNCPDLRKEIDVQSISEAMNMIKNEKDQRLHKIFTFRYLEGKGNNLMPWKDVCCQEGINLSVQGCINVHNQYIKKIRKENK